MARLALCSILTVCLLQTTLAVNYRPWDGDSWRGNGRPFPIKRPFGPSVVSRREAETSPTADIYQLVQDTLNKAREGIAAGDLEEAAESVEEAVDNYLAANGGEVPSEQVQALINEVAAGFGGSATVAALFDDPVTYQSNLMDAALTLWEGLVKKAQELETSGQSPSAALAAIGLTAESIKEIVDDTVDIVTYVRNKIILDAVEEAANGDSKNPSTRLIDGAVLPYNPQYPGWPPYKPWFKNVGRSVDIRQWKANANVGYDNGRWSGSGGISYQKGNWNFNANVGYNNGWTGGLGLSYSWGR